MTSHIPKTNLDLLGGQLQREGTSSNYSNKHHQNLDFLGGQLQREGTSVDGSLVRVFGTRDGNGTCSVNARVHNPLSLSNANTAAL